MSDVPDVTRASGVNVATECISSMLNLFDDQKADYAIETLYRSWYAPLAAITDSTNVIDFNMPGDGDYVNLKNTVLEIVVSITKADGTAIPADVAAAHTGFCQVPLTTLFKSVDVKIGDCTLSDSFNTNHLSSYFLLATSFEKGSRKSRLMPMGW